MSGSGAPWNVIAALKKKLPQEGTITPGAGESLAESPSTGRPLAHGAHSIGYRRYALTDPFR